MCEGWNGGAPGPQRQRGVAEFPIRPMALPRGGDSRFPTKTSGTRSPYQGDYVPCQGRQYARRCGVPVLLSSGLAVGGPRQPPDRFAGPDDTPFGHGRAQHCGAVGQDGDPIAGGPSGYHRPLVLMCASVSSRPNSMCFGVPALYSETKYQQHPVQTVLSPDSDGARVLLTGCPGTQDRARGQSRTRTRGNTCQMRSPIHAGVPNDSGCVVGWSGRNPIQTIDRKIMVCPVPWWGRRLFLFRHS